jgi:hypothetical protein
VQYTCDHGVLATFKVKEPASFFMEVASFLQNKRLATGRLPGRNTGATEQWQPPLPAPRFISHRYVAHILNAAITGSGDTPSAAKESFGTVRNRWLEDGKPLVRPGMSWPVESASQEQVNEYEALSEDFIHRVLDLDWAWISDESSLWDFHAESDNSRLNAKVMEVYGVDVSDIQSGRLAAIFERIVQSRSEPARSIGTPHPNGESR